MNEKTEMLHKLCEALTGEMEEYAKKIDRSDGMSAGDLDAIDKLSHALKSIKTTIAMMDADNGYSGRMMPSVSGGSYRGGIGYGGASYARGRGRNARRDSMGRYSGGYSYAESMEDLLDEMREMIPGLSEEKRRKAEQLIEEIGR